MGGAEMMEQPAGEIELAVGLVGRVRACRQSNDVAGERRTTEQLLREMEPVVRRAAKRCEKVRGSVGLDDLLQVGRIEVLKAIDTFTEERGGSFAMLVAFMARGAMINHTQRHSADVRPSDGAQRGRVQKIGEAPVIGSLDAPARGDAGDDRSEVHDRLDPVPLADEQLDAEQMRVLVRKFLHRLPRHMADLIRKVHGIGVEPMSVRDIAETTGQNRARLTKELKRGEQLLGAMILRETRADPACRETRAGGSRTTGEKRPYPKSA